VESIKLINVSKGRRFWWGLLAKMLACATSENGRFFSPVAFVESNMVNQTGFQDGAFALAMSTFWNGKKKVLRLRKRPKETAGNAKVLRAPFGNEATKKLWIPELYDAYNKHMRAVDIGD
jgi:hypothetical protein